MSWQRYSRVESKKGLVLDCCCITNPDALTPTVVVSKQLVFRYCPVRIIRKAEVTHGVCIAVFQPFRNLLEHRLLLQFQCARGPRPPYSTVLYHAGEAKTESSRYRQLIYCCSCACAIFGVSVRSGRILALCLRRDWRY